MLEPSPRALANIVVTAVLTHANADRMQMLAAQQMVASPGMSAHDPRPHAQLAGSFPSVRYACPSPHAGFDWPYIA